MTDDRRRGEDQFALFGDERRDRLREIYEAGDRWTRRIEHLRVCTVKPWWDSPHDCKCQEKST